MQLSPKHLHSPRGRQRAPDATDSRENAEEGKIKRQRTAQLPFPLVGLAQQHKKAGGSGGCCDYTQKEK